jgi:hypothetical protein
MKTKHCNRCGKELNIKEFNKNKTTKDGLAYYCRSCRSKERNEINRETNRMYSIKHNAKLRIGALKTLSGDNPYCEICGFSDDIRFLHIDHRNGGGEKERKILHHSALHSKIIKMGNEAKKEYRVLCVLHNWAGRYGITGEEYIIIKKKDT